MQLDLDAVIVNHIEDIADPSGTRSVSTAPRQGSVLDLAWKHYRDDGEALGIIVDGVALTFDEARNVAIDSLVMLNGIPYAIS